MSGQQTVAAGYALSYEENIPSESEDLVLVCSIDVSAMRSLFMLSSEAIAVTFVGPGTTITLEAGIPFVWVTGSGLAAPLGSDVTGVTITNNTSFDANFQMEILTDPTP